MDIVRGIILEIFNCFLELVNYNSYHSGSTY